ncbi:MAG: flagellar motor switch protein FliG [Gemmatimonadetes bacterium]|jgi:flagellar motor switch protein FliG|nr:flagellar motor switch protein FliG [Gemmatimonadota bacterium]
MSKAKMNQEERIFGHGAEELRGEGVGKWAPGSREGLKKLSPLEEYPSEVPEIAAKSSDDVEDGREVGEAGGSAADSSHGGKGAGAAEPPIDEDMLSPVQRLVLERTEEAAGLTISMLMNKAEAWKAGVVMVTLGERLAGELMKRLSDFEIEEVTQAIGGLEQVGAEDRRRVTEEFQQRLIDGEYSIKGGTDFARAALERAVGPRKAGDILEQVSRKFSSGFYMLKNVEADQIAPFISYEHPQTIALILSQLDPGKASGILARLPEQMQADVAYRIATMENITPAIIKQIEESLESSLRDILGGNQDVGGPKVVADMLNMTGSSTEKNVLDRMDGQDPEVAEAVRNEMFIFEDIGKLTDREIQTLMRDVDQKDLVIALKAASNDLKDKVLGNMSEKVRTFITEEMEFLGPMRLSEVAEVQLRIVQQVRQLEEQGQITIVRGDADDTFV